MMRKNYIPIFAFLSLLILTFRFSFGLNDFAEQGWHVTIFPAYFIWLLIGLAIFLFAVIGYWLLTSRANKTAWGLFAIHFVLTIPSIVYLMIPSIFLDTSIIESGELMNVLHFRIRLIPVAWALFIIGQVLFLVYFIRTIKQEKLITT